MKIKLHWECYPAHGRKLGQATFRMRTRALNSRNALIWYCGSDARLLFELPTCGLPSILRNWHARSKTLTLVASPEFNIKHRAYVTNAVLSSSAFLEAAVNEVFDDVADNKRGYIEPLSAECRRLMVGRWNKKVERGPTLKNIKSRCAAAQSPFLMRRTRPMGMRFCSLISATN